MNQTNRGVKIPKRTLSLIADKDLRRDITSLIKPLLSKPGEAGLDFVVACFLLRNEMREPIMCDLFFSLAVKQSSPYVRAHTLTHSSAAFLGLALRHFVIIRRYVYTSIPLTHHAASDGGLRVKTGSDIPAQQRRAYRVSGGAKYQRHTTNEELEKVMTTGVG